MIGDQHITLSDLREEPLIIGSRHVKTRSLADEIGQVNVVATFRKGHQLTNALQSLVDLIQSCS